MQPHITTFLTGEDESEVAQIQAVLSCVAGSKPLLVLSCISREDLEAVEAADLQTAASRSRSRRRIPCVYMARRLGLPQLDNPWMVNV